MNVSPSNLVRAEALPLERLAANPNLTEQAKIGEAARQFEAVLLRQILAEARKGVHDEALGESSATLGLYHDLINNALADSISRNGMLGLASSLQTQLTRQTAESPSPQPDPTP
jgi:flagellar protein FlgJ